MSRSVAVSQRMSSYLEHTQMYTQTPILLHPRDSWSLSMFTNSNSSKLKPIKNRCFLSNIQSPTSRNLFVTCIWWMEETNRWNCFFRVSNFSCSCFSLSSSCPSSSLFICTDVKSLSSLLMWFHGFISKKFVVLQLFFSLPSPSSFFEMSRKLRSGYLTVSRRVVEESRSGWDWITWEATMSHQNEKTPMRCWVVLFSSFQFKLIFIECAIRMDPEKREYIDRPAGFEADVTSADPRKRDIGYSEWWCRWRTNIRCDFCRPSNANGSLGFSFLLLLSYSRWSSIESTISNGYSK